MKYHTSYRVHPGGRLTGRLRVPGDKSISHRALILGAVAEGDTAIRGFLEGADCLATLRAFRAMGVAIEGPRAGRVTIHRVHLYFMSFISEVRTLLWYRHQYAVL